MVSPSPISRSGTMSLSLSPRFENASTSAPVAATRRAVVGVVVGVGRQLHLPAVGGRPSKGFGVVPPERADGFEHLGRAGEAREGEEAAEGRVDEVDLAAPGPFEGIGRPYPGGRDGL